MANYNLPEAALTVKKKVLAVRTKNNKNQYNFGNKIQCAVGCQEANDSPHILIVITLLDDRLIK